MDLLNVVIRADTSGSDRARDSLDQMHSAARGADAAVDAVAATTDKASASARMNAEALKAQAQAARIAGAANDNLRMNTANIAAQFQDIGVTAAMGMNPLMIALQQGTQLSAVFSAQSGGALKALGAALLSVFSPISIVTIALVALVAAGMQMADWGATAEIVLNAIANLLVPIAPYAAAAAAGLALLYSPAIMAGVFGVIGLLAGLAKQALITAAALAMANPVGLLIAGFALVATAAVIFRGDLAKLFGRDIVADAQQGVNWIIGAFVGGFQSISLIWAALPNIMGDLTAQAAQAVVDGVTNLLNESRTQVIGFLSWVSTLPLPGINSLAGAAVGGLAGAGGFTAPTIKNDDKGFAGAAVAEVGDIMSSAMDADYVGQATAVVQGAASGAADALRKMADAAGASGEETDKAGKAAAKAAEAYRDLTRSAREFIAGKDVEIEALGLTEAAASRLRFEQEMLNKAANDNIALSPAQRAEIAMLAASMAEAEQALAGVQLALGDPSPWEVMRGELASLDIALAKGKISLTQYQAAAARSMAGATGATIDSIGQITGVLAGAFEDNKALAIANAVVSTAGGVMKALEQGGMFGWPMAAAIAAAGAVQIGTIMSASPGGGSSSVRTPSASVPAVQNAPQRQQADKAPERMDITLHGLDRSAMYDGHSVERLLQAIEERSADGRILKIKVA